MSGITTTKCSVCSRIVASQTYELDMHQNSYGPKEVHVPYEIKEILFPEGKKIINLCEDCISGADMTTLIKSLRIEAVNKLYDRVLKEREDRYGEIERAKLAVTQCDDSIEIISRYKDMILADQKPLTLWKDIPLPFAITRRG